MAKKYLSFIVLMLALEACCYKQECTNVDAKVIPIRFRNFERHDLDGLTIIMLNKEMTVVQDSVVKQQYDRDFIYISDATFGYGTAIEPKDHSFILKTLFTTDTFLDLTYEEYSYMINCDPCRPYHEKVELHKLREFSFKHEGKIYLEDEEVVISK